MPDDTNTPNPAVYDPDQPAPTVPPSRRLASVKSELALDLLALREALATPAEAGDEDDDLSDAQMLDVPEILDALDEANWDDDTPSGADDNSGHGEAR